jgi:hypothetical protein
LAADGILNKIKAMVDNSNVARYQRAALQLDQLLDSIQLINGSV